MATVERRRRPKDDGSPGEVRYRVRWRDPDGKQRSKSFARRRDADHHATKVSHDLLAGAYVDPLAGRTTLRDYAEAWRRAQVWAPGTDEKAESHFRLHVYPALGDRPIGSIRRSDIQGWVKALTGTLAPATVGVIATQLSSVMKAAVSDRVIVANPCGDVELPRVPRKEVVPPHPTQVDLLAATVPDEFRALVAVGAGLGLRVGEALGLTADRIDWQGQVVRIDRQAQPRPGQGVLLEALKTDAAARTLPLPDTVAWSVSAHIERHGLGDHGALFHRLGGRLLRRQRVADLLREAVTTTARDGRLAPLSTGLRFHDLRHFYASLLIASGASVKTVQKRLGHASATETLDTYGHLWPDNEEQTRAAVDAVLTASVAHLWPAGFGSAPDQGRRTSGPLPRLQAG